MYRLIGIIIAACGVLVAALGFANVLPHMGTSGIFLVIVGVLLIGLSFVPLPESVESEPMPFPMTLLKMFYAPTEVFQNLRRHPKFLGVVLMSTLISGAYTVAFVNKLTPERIANHTIEKLSEKGWVPADKMGDVKSQTLETTKNPYARAGQIVNSFGWGVLLVSFLGLVFWLIALAFGGKMNYLQAVSATAYASFPIVVIQKGLSFLILYLKDATEIHPILGQNGLLQDSLNFLITPSASPVLFVLLSSISLLAIYSLWLLATGLKNTGDRVSSGAAWTSAILLWILGTTAGTVMAIFFGNFMT